MSIVTKKQTIYLDNAAATPIHARVQMEINKTSKLYGNPSSFNNKGREARQKMDNSRAAVAKFLGAHPEEIIFTASGSEANNLAILGVARNKIKKGEILITAIEHPSVLEPLKILKKEGWKISYLRVNREGMVDVEDFKSKLNTNVVLVSIMYANNEIGTIQPIKFISKIINNFRNSKPEIYEKAYPLFHSDACQATEYLDMNVNNLGVDLLTLNGSKIYGPRGVAVLFKKKRVLISPLVHGGDQERGMRAGTENLPAIAGLVEALSLINRKKESKRVMELKDYFCREIIKILPDVRINGPLGKERLPNNINISIPGLSSENLLLEMDKYGISASSGSACTAHSVEPSHVLKAIGVENKYLDGALRLSLGRNTKARHVKHLIKVLPDIVGNLKRRYKI